MNDDPTTDTGKKPIHPAKFYKDDIKIVDYRVIISLWNRQTGISAYLADISDITMSDITITKERNMPDTCEFEIEYTQFKRFMKYEGNEPQNVLMPFLTEIRIERNFETIFAGTLFHLRVSLGEVGNETLTLKCCSWGEHFEKRFVSETFHGTYPSIAQQLVLAGQHELNWIDNYAFEYTDEHFQGWTWSNATEQNKAPAKSKTPHWGGGIQLGSGQSMWTYSMQSDNHFGENRMDIGPLYFSFWYKATSSGSLRLTLHGDNQGDIGTQVLSYNASVTYTSDWKQFVGTIPAANISQKIRWIKLQAAAGNMEISDLQLYTKPEQGDPYDLDISIGEFDPMGHKYDSSRVRHYHLQNVKDALHNVAKLSSALGPDGLPDTFEYEFDANKKFNIKYKLGLPVADPYMAATYPGIIKRLDLERGLEDVFNVNYASSEEEKTYKNKDGEEETVVKKWAGSYSGPFSMHRFGAQCQFNDYESVHSYDDLDNVAGSDLQVYDEVQNIPEVEVDSNQYNLGNIALGDAIIVTVLNDGLFEFVNGTYRIYSLECSINRESVEHLRLTLVPPNLAGLQLISFPKQYKYLTNDVKRLMTR